ncbi:MAG TPA: hypothetical protein VNZ86_05490, partial [Bacteroidia bacterium]|nr:hypothetical protein [Bacteroidia bacterium]
MKLKTAFHLFLPGIFLFTGSNQAQSWQWAKTAVVQTNQSSFANAVTGDAQGNAYVTGSFYSPTIRFDTTTLYNNSPNGFDLFLVKYRPNGSVAWARSFGGSGNDEGYGITLDAQKHIYICGAYDSPVFQLGTASFSNAGGSDLFLAKLDSMGHVIWARNAGGSGNDLCNSICVDAQNRPCIAGSFNSPFLSLGSTTLTDTTSQTQPLIARYDANGTLLWAHTAAGTGGTNGNYAASVCSDTA